VSTDNNIIISARRVSRVFGSGEQQVMAVNQVDMDVSRGEFLAVVGRSGSGKTTLLNLLSGLDRPSSGSVLFEGREIGELPDTELVKLRRYRMSFIFQSFALLPLLSAYENVELPLRIQGVAMGERRRKVEQALAKIGLAPRSHHRPYELSGGEQQRVGIARAIVTSPQVIFADEPTGELDSTNAQMVGDILRDITSKDGVTMVVVTHDLSVAGMADRIVELVDGAVVSTGGSITAEIRRQDVGR
jgi:putative ABC transport system ATP-binding protein